MFGKKNKWDPDSSDKNRYPLLYGGKAADPKRKRGKLFRKHSLFEVTGVVVLSGLALASIKYSYIYIEASQVRSLTGQISGFEQAVYLFENKYKAIPGDITNPMEHGLTRSLCARDSGASPPLVPGCGGNGDGLLTSDIHNAENISFWHHLYMAGLIEEPYDGISIQFGVGAPKASIQNIGVWAEAVEWGEFGVKNFFYMGLNDQNFYPTLTAAHAYQFDTKIDDGLPATGKTRFAGISDSCVNKERTPWRYEDQTPHATCTLYHYMPNY